MVGSTASSLLSDLFSRAEVELDIPFHHADQASASSSSSSSSSRDVAFYDEHLEARLRLRLPSSSAHLPAPQRGHATYSIPLTLDDDDDVIDWEERTEQARSTRLVLLSILCNLAIEARGSYVSPRPPLSTRDVVVPPTTANTKRLSGMAAAAVAVEDHARPRPAMSEPQREAQYQNIDAALGDEVSFYSVAWQGNKVSSRPASKQRAASPTPSTLPGTVAWHSPSSSWIVEWPVIVPITYARHRHPNPALLITASLSLRLSPSSPLLAALTAELSGQTQYLAMLPPELRPAREDDAEDAEALSWSDHDLLSTLSSGPVYPDESPSQRAARAASALAKLPLSRLPTKVLGSRLATPERSARDVGKKMSRTRDDDGSEGGGAESDLTDFSSSSSSSSAASSTASSSARSSLTRTSSASSDFSDPASYGAPKAKSTSRDDDELDHGTSIVTLSRSVRRGLDVRSAVGVRMRTTVIEDAELPLRAGSSAVHHRASTTSRALVLSVEVDNPADSGLVFQVVNCDVEVLQPSQQPDASSSSRSGWQADARLVEGGTTRFDLAQGEQRNLVYFVRFVPASAPSDVTATEALASSASTMRSVSIVVHGKPAMMGRGNVDEGRLLTPDFSSVWSCTLDFRSLLEDAARREVLRASQGPAAAEVLSVSTSMAPAVVSGSHRHAATALQQARAQDEENRAAAAAAAMTTNDQRPGLDRSSSGLANGPLARFTSSASRVGPRTSSLQPDAPPAPSPSSATPLPSPLRQVSASSSTSSSSTAISPAGLGLLAQAKLRAASAADRVASGQGEDVLAHQHTRVSSLASVASSAAGRARTSSTSSMRSNSASWDRAPSGSSTLYGPRDRVRRSVSTTMTATRPVAVVDGVISGDSSYAPRSAMSSFDTGLQQQQRGGTGMSMVGTQVVLPVRKGARMLVSAEHAPLLVSTRVVLAPPRAGEEEGPAADGHHRVRYAWLTVEATLKGDAIEAQLPDTLRINYVAARRASIVDDEENGDDASSRLDVEGAPLTQARGQAIVARHSGAKASTVLPLEKDVALVLTPGQDASSSTRSSSFGSCEVPLLVVTPAEGRRGEDLDDEEAVMRVVAEGELEVSCDGERTWLLKLGA